MSICQSTNIVYFILWCTAWRSGTNLRSSSCHILTATVYERLLPELREAATAELRRASAARPRLAATPTGGLYEAKGGGAVRAASAVPEALTAEERAEFARTLKRIETANAAEAPLASGVPRPVVVGLGAAPPNPRD